MTRFTTCLAGFIMLNLGPVVAAENPGTSSFTLSINSTAGGIVTEPGEGELIYRAGSDVSFCAAADPYFVFSHWSGTINSTENPFHVKVERGGRIQAHFVSTLNTIYVDFNIPHL